MDGSTCELKSDSEEVSQARDRSLSEMTLLDLYSGCGAMSTGLCLGANMFGVNLVTVCYGLLYYSSYLNTWGYLLTFSNVMGFIFF